MSDPKAPFGSTEIEVLRYIGDHHPISVGEMAEYVAENHRAGTDHGADDHGTAAAERPSDPQAKSVASIATPPRSPSRLFCKVW